MSSGSVPDEVLDRILSTRAPAPRSVLSDLEGPNGLRLFLYLDENAPVLKTDVYRDISKSPKMKDRLERMQELGLIEMRYAGRVNATVVMMTPKGKAIARRVRWILDSISYDKSP